MRSNQQPASQSMQSQQQPMRSLRAALLPNPRQAWRGFFVAYYYYFSYFFGYFFGYRQTPARAAARTMLA